MNPCTRNLFATAAFVCFAGTGCSVANEDQTIRRIAFGSCARQDEPQPIWDHVVASRPDVFLFIGDNIYADTEDMSVMRQKYAQLAAKPGYQKLLRTCPVRSATCSRTCCVPSV